MLAEFVDHVIGVDPDRDRFTVSLIVAVSGGEVASEEFAATRRGYSEAVEWADTYSAAESRAWVLEGAGSYGSGLCQTLSREAEWVIEFDRPTVRSARDGAKTDHLDALRAGREALGRVKWADPRARGSREGLRALLVARNGAQQSRTAAINELRALVLTAPVDLREELRDLSRTQLLKRCSRLRPGHQGDLELFGTKTALRALAQRIEVLTAEAASLEQAMAPLIDDLGPQLLNEFGIGTVTAAQILISWSHPGRCRNDAAFSRLAGVAPIEVTSGQNQDRFRLNRGGDRQLNRALHQIVLTRSAHDPATKAYIERRKAEGKTSRDARRCLKRFIARRIHNILENPPQTT